MTLEKALGPAYAGQTYVTKDGFPLGYYLDVEVEAGATKLTKQTVHAFMQQGKRNWRTAWDLYIDAYVATGDEWRVLYNQTPVALLGMGEKRIFQTILQKDGSVIFLWQYTSEGRLNGYAGNLDVNKFNGSVEDYYRILIGEEGYTPPEATGPLTELYRPCDRWAYITQTFGANPGWYPASKGHNGIDFGFNYTTGHPIYAAADGIVEVSRDDKTGYGRHIRIRHSHGVTIYGHLV